MVDRVVDEVVEGAVDERVEMGGVDEVVSSAPQPAANRAIEAATASASAPGLKSRGSSLPGAARSAGSR